MRVTNTLVEVVAYFLRVHPGKTYMMLGVDDSPMNLGVIPSAIAWLYRLVDEQRLTTGARFSVRVSAVEVTGRHETVKDLLANVTAGIGVNYGGFHTPILRCGL